MCFLIWTIPFGDFERNSELTFQSIFKNHDLRVDLENFLKAYTPINFKFWKLYREEKVTKENLRYQRLKQSFDVIGKKVDDDTIHRLSEDYIKNLSSFGHLVSGTFEIPGVFKRFISIAYHYKWFCGNAAEENG